MVGATGFEPAASWSRTKRATKLRYAPKVYSIYYTFMKPKSIPIKSCKNIAKRRIIDNLKEYKFITIVSFIYLLGVLYENKLFRCY